MIIRGDWRNYCFCWNCDNNYGLLQL